MQGDKPEDLIRAWNRTRNRLPRAVASTARQFFKESFRNQGFDPGGGVQRWQPRSPKAVRNKGRAILVDSGRLRNSVRIIRADRRRIAVGSTLPYAKAHNFGFRASRRVRIRSHLRQTRRGTHRVKAHNRNARFNIPRRPFVGRSSKLNREIARTVIRQMEKML